MDLTVVQHKKGLIAAFLSNGKLVGHVFPLEEDPSRWDWCDQDGYNPDELGEPPSGFPSKDAALEALRKFTEEKVKSGEILL